MTDMQNKFIAAATTQLRRIPGNALVCLGLFSLTCGIFLSAPVEQIADSRYSLMLSEHLLRHGEFDLQTEFELPLDPARFPSLVANGYPQIMQPYGDKGQVFYGASSGSSILSIPLLIALRPFGARVYGADGKYDAAGEVRAQMLIAAMVMAALCVVIYLIGLEFLNALPSFLIAMTTALGTQVMSTATRSLWSHTWLILLLGLAILILVRAEVAGKNCHPVLLATLLSWMYFVRPTASIPIFCIAVFVAFRHPRKFAWFALMGAAWLALFMAHAHVLYGRLLPPYYQPDSYTGMIAHHSYFLNLYSVLFSPSRGEFTTVPAMLVALYLAIRYWPEPRLRALCLLACGGILTQSLLVARYIYGGFYGGSSFGARYSTDVIPWFALFAIIGLAGRTKETRPRHRFFRLLEWTLISILILASCYINLRGAYSYPTWAWNGRLQQDPEQVYASVSDWRYPQWLAGVIPPPLPVTFVKFPVGKEVPFGPDSVNAYFREQYGWSYSGGESRRTLGTRADLVFALDGEKPVAIEIRLQPYLVSPQLMRQRVRIDLNGTRVGEISVSDYQPRTYRMPVSPALWRPKNLLIFHLPDARSPKSFGQSPDFNVYGISMFWLKLVTHDQPPVAIAKKP